LRVQLRIPRGVKTRDCLAQSGYMFVKSYGRSCTKLPRAGKKLDACAAK
jgi:hypothetical protein